jgi:hypothetical protein
MAPDQLAHIIDQHKSFPGYGEALEWFYRTALASIREQQYARNVDRHRRVARQSGHPSYYARRVALAQAQECPSLWAYRKHRGWA